MPALLTRISSLPCFSITDLIRPSTAAASVTSSADASALPPDAAIAAAVASALVPRATQITVAPPAASRSAIARPIPRDAPVTIAILPSKEVRTVAERLDRRQVVGTFDVLNGGAGRDPLDHSTQCFARPYFNISGDALGRKALYDVFPTHRRCNLLDQGVDRRRRGALRLGIDVGDDRHARIATSAPRAAPGVRRTSAGFISAQ